MDEQQELNDQNLQTWNSWDYNLQIVVNQELQLWNNMNEIKTQTIVYQLTLLTN